MKVTLSKTVVFSLCVLSFLFGRFLQIMPTLPERNLDGPTIVSEADDQYHQQQPQRDPAGGGGVGDGGRVAMRRATLEQMHDEEVHPPPRLLPQSFDEAVKPLLDARPPLHPTDSGLNNYVAQPYQLLSWYPRIYLFPKFISDEMCDQLITEATARLAPSTLALRKSDTEEGTRNIRTSQGTFMGRKDSTVLAALEDKISAVTGLPVNYGEDFNLLRYNLGQRYKSHFDYFEEDGYGKLNSNRLATVLMYLTTVEQGGETIFPVEGKDGLKRFQGIDYGACDMGFKYKPRKGDALLFYSMYPNNTLDRHSLHGGCPVIKGTKWVATKWIRNKCYRHCTHQD